MNKLRPLLTSIQFFVGELTPDDELPDKGDPGISRIGLSEDGSLGFTAVIRFAGGSGVWNVGFSVGDDQYGGGPISFDTPTMTMPGFVFIRQMSELWGEHAELSYRFRVWLDGELAGEKILDVYRPQ